MILVMVMIESNGLRFGLGDRVRVRGKSGEAHIKEFYADIEGGVKLDDKIGDFYSWNVENLELVARGERKKTVAPEKEKERGKSALQEK